MTDKLTPKQEKILTLKTQNPNATGTEIAKLANADVSYTIEILERYGLTSKKIDDYKANRADIWAGLQHRLLSSINQADIEKATIQQRIVSAGIAHDKELELTGNKRDVTPMVIINKINIGKVEGKREDSQIIDIESVVNNTQDTQDIGYKQQST